MNSQDVIQRLKQRQATKQFDANYNLSHKQLETIIDAVNLAPTSFGLQPFKLIHIKDKKVRKQIQAIAWNQPQITQSSELLLWTIEADLHYVLKRYATKSMQVRRFNSEQAQEYVGFIAEFIKNKEASSPNFYEYWAARQAYIALGFAIETCALLGIDSCPIEGFDNSQMDNFLDLPTKGLKSVALLALGRKLEQEEVKPKIRLQTSELVETI